MNGILIFQKAIKKSGTFCICVRDSSMGGFIYRISLKPTHLSAYIFVPTGKSVLRVIQVSCIRNHQEVVDKQGAKILTFMASFQPKKV